MLRRFILAVLCLVAASAEAATFYIGPTGQTLYVRIQTGPSSFVATALTEGSTSLLNHYALADATVAALTGMSSAGDYAFQVRVGGTPSTTAADAIVGFGTLYWTGATERPASANVSQWTGTAVATPTVAGYPLVHDAMGPRTWYVSEDTDGAGDTGTRAAPFDTFAAAQSAASPGDIIHILDTSYDADISVSKSGITLEGEGYQATTITSANPIAGASVDDITIRNLKCNSTDTVNGAGITFLGCNNITVERCYVIGHNDGAVISATPNFRLVGSFVQGDFDACNFAGSRGVVLDSYLTTDGSYATPQDARAIVAAGSQIYVRDSTLVSARTASTTKHAIGIAVDGTSASSDPLCVAERTRIIVSDTNAGSTGGVYGVGYGSSASTRFNRVYLVDCTITRSQAGSGASYDVDASRTGTLPSFCRVSRTPLAAYTGDVKEVLIATTPGNSLDVASTGEAGVDLANIKQATGSTTLTNITVPTVTTLTNGVTVASGGITSGSFAANSITASAVASDAATEIGAAAGGAPDTRDLAPVQFTWKLSRRSENTLVSTNTLHIAPGETLRVGFDCDTDLVLPGAAVLGSMTDPTTTSADLTVTKLGIDPNTAKVSVEAAGDATVDGETVYVRATVVNSSGAGPVTLIGKVKIVTDPTQ